MAKNNYYCNETLIKKLLKNADNINIKTVFVEGK